MVLVTIANAMIDGENDVLQRMTRTLESTSIIAGYGFVYSTCIYNIFFQLIGKPAVR